MNIVHGGIISTLLDEAMVKLALAMEMPAVTAHMEIRLKRALMVGEKITVEAEIVSDTKKMLETFAKAVREDNVLIADAKGKLVKV
jgi:acyl-coenzyme A thioesterase PaaI-like protein